MTSSDSHDAIGRFLSIGDAAEMLAVDVATVDRLIKSGELPAIRVGQAGPWRIERTRLEIWIDLQYEDSRRAALWEQGEFAGLDDLAAVRPSHLRAVD